MKTKYFLAVIGIFFFLAFVSADIVSVNSGGSNNIIVNAGRYIEGFFFSANHAPVLSSVVLSSTSGNNLTTDNLTVSFTGSDTDGNYFTNITDWRLNGNSIEVLNMPFDKNVESVSTGAVRDYTSYENNGTLGGGNSTFAPTWNASCQVGGCYEFQNKTDYIALGNVLSVGTYNWTTCNWFNWDGSSGDNIIYNKENLYELKESNGYVQYAWQPHWAWDGGSSFVVSQNTWYFACVVYDHNSQYLYKNGVLVYSRAQTGDIGSNSNPVYLGRRSYASPNSFFGGSIDEVQIFNKALTSEQINAMYEAGLNHHHLDTMTSSMTNVGGTWQVASTPDDSITDGATVLSNNLTIQDAAPNEPTNVNLVSLDGTNQSNSDLNCSYYLSDIDSSNLDSTVRWFRDGTLYLTQGVNNIANGTSSSSILGSGNLTLGDTWFCSVRSYDGSKYSNWVNSNNLTIIDTTSPNVTIISPQPTNYSTINVPFNVSVHDNEAVSSCEYSLDSAANVTMNKINSTYYSYSPSLGPGPHIVQFYCNDTSNNWGYNETNFSIDNSAAIAISFSNNLSQYIKWDVVNLPAVNLDALGNNLNGTTSYYINISAINTLVDLYVKANGDLTDAALDTIGLGNETYKVSLNDPTLLTNSTNYTMSTNYTKIVSGVGGNKTLYMKFYLDAPSSQAAGEYLNQLSFKAVRKNQVA